MSYLQKTKFYGGHFEFWALEKNAQHIQSGIHWILIQHIEIDQKQQKNFIYIEKQGPTPSSPDYFGKDASPLGIWYCILQFYR